MQNPKESCSCAATCTEYRIDLINIHSGYSEKDTDFQNRYDLDLPDVNLECIRCCSLLFVVFKRKEMPRLGRLATFCNISNITASTRNSTVYTRHHSICKYSDWWRKERPDSYET